MTRAHVWTYLLTLSHPAQFLGTHVPSVNVSREVTKRRSSHWERHSRGFEASQHSETHQSWWLWRKVRCTMWKELNHKDAVKESGA